MLHGRPAWKYSRSLAIWVAAFAGTALALTFVTQAAGPGSPLGTPPNAVTVVAPSPSAPSSLSKPSWVPTGGPPAATPADVNAAEAVLKSDQVFKSIVGRIGYTVTASTPWEDNAGASVLGTELTLQLDSPLSGTFQLPGVSFPSSLDPSVDPRTYQQLMVPLTVTGATTLTVLVDLGAHKVASVQPPQSTLSSTPNTPSYSSSAGDGS